MRLIDADELRWAIRNNASKSVPIWVYQTIDNAPTAYDVDKVVAQLEDRKSLMLETFKISESDIDRGRIYGMDKAIEIVKAGGADEM